MLSVLTRRILKKKGKKQKSERLRLTFVIRQQHRDRLPHTLCCKHQKAAAEHQIRDLWRFAEIFLSILVQPFLHCEDAFCSLCIPLNVSLKV